MFSRKVIYTLVALALVGGVGCGNKNNPAPPPPPQIANPNPNGGFVGGGGSCGGISGTPINNGQPFNATMNGGYGTGNSLALTLAYPTTGGYGPTTAVVGSAQVVLQDLQQMFNQYITQYSFCASSIDPTTGAVNMGSLSNGTYVSLSLSGIIQVPSQSYAPYGYPGTQQFQPMPIYVDIGQYGDAYINNNRLSGTVVISFGTRGSNSVSYSLDGQGGGGNYGGGYNDPYGYGGYNTGGYYDPYYGGYY